MDASRVRPVADEDRPLYCAYEEERARLIYCAAALHYLHEQDEAALTAHAQLIACATNGTLDIDTPNIRERILAQVEAMRSDKPAQEAAA